MAIHVTKGGRDHKPTDDCWICKPGATGQPCATHNRQIRDAATAQAQQGYGRPGRTS